MSDLIGKRGFWIEDNCYCEIVAVVNEGAGLYEFKPLEWAPEGGPWIGFIEDFFPEFPEVA